MKRAALWPPSHNITSKKKRLPLLLALPSRRGLERLAAVEVGRLAGLPSTLLTAGLDVVRLLARLALVERGVELRQDVPWRVRDVAEHQQLALDRPDDVEQRHPAEHLWALLRRRKRRLQRLRGGYRRGRA